MSKLNKFLANYFLKGFLDESLSRRQRTGRLFAGPNILLSCSSPVRCLSNKAVFSVVVNVVGGRGAGGVRLYSQALFYFELRQPTKKTMNFLHLYKQI